VTKPLEKGRNWKKLSERASGVVMTPRTDQEANWGLTGRGKRKKQAGGKKRAGNTVNDEKRKPNRPISN